MVVDSYRHFRPIVEVAPVWSADGELTGLVSSLSLPNDQDLIDLGKEFGLTFEGFGASMFARFKHGTSEEALVQALQTLHQPQFMQRLLPRMRSYWGD